MFSFSLYPLINRPTWEISTSATLKDNIWTSQPEENVSSHIIHTDILDHFPMFFQCKLIYPTYKPQYIDKRFVTDAALEVFSNCLSATEWNDVLNSSCPDEAYNVSILHLSTYFKYISQSRIFVLKNLN